MAFILRTDSKVDVFVVFICLELCQTVLGQSAEPRMGIFHFQNILQLQIQTREMLCDLEIMLCFKKLRFAGDLRVDRASICAAVVCEKLSQFLKGRVEVADVSKRDPAALYDSARPSDLSAAPRSCYWIAGA